MGNLQNDKELFMFVAKGMIYILKQDLRAIRYFVFFISLDS